MNMKKTEALQGFIDQQAQFVAITFDRQGRVRNYNNFTRRRLAKQKDEMTYHDVFIDFSKNINLDELINNPEPILLNLQTETENPESFYFVFIPVDQEILALGQREDLEMQNLQSQLMSMTSELSNLNRELFKKNHELARLNQLKNQFVGMAAHDLRSPLGHIATCSEFLMEELGNSMEEAQRTFLRVISDSSRFMLTMIDDILDISAIEAGRLELRLTKCKLPELIRSAAAFNTPIAEKEDIEIKLDLGGEPLELCIDDNKITQVLNNLLSNAIKYSPDQSVITVSLFTSNTDAVISVADQGPGISSEDIGLIFQPFQKAATRPRDGSKSTGLGLAIVRHIIHGHGGRVWVDSQLGEGSTFYFTVPLDRDNGLPDSPKVMSD